MSPLPCCLCLRILWQSSNFRSASGDAKINAGRELLRTAFFANLIYTLFAATYFKTTKFIFWRSETSKSLAINIMKVNITERRVLPTGREYLTRRKICLAPPSGKILPTPNFTPPLSLPHHQRLILPLNNSFHVINPKNLHFQLSSLLLYNFYFNFILFVYTGQANFDVNQCSLFKEC